MKVTLVLVFNLFLLINLSGQALSMGDMEIRITGVRNSTGSISVNIFNQPVGFPNDPLKSFGWKTVRIVPDTVVIVFEDLPFGEYAVSVLHDENCNGKMEKNFLGIPQEGFAFSNNYAPKYQMPSFFDVRIKLKQAKIFVGLKMLYY